jgi:hypothetical protein
LPKFFLGPSIIRWDRKNMKNKNFKWPLLETCSLD